MEKIYFIDFDGVILKTNDLVVNIVLEKINEDGLNEIFEELNWEELYNKAEVINNSISSLKMARNQLKIVIITKIKHLNEAISKIKFLKDNELNFPIMFVPIHSKKTDIIRPKANYILIDDDQENIEDWARYGAKAIKFNSKIDKLADILKN